MCFLEPGKHGEVVLAVTVKGHGLGMSPWWPNGI